MMDREINERTVGAAPAGAPDRESAAKAVREMFTSIAPRYDLLNHVLSFNIDRLWWRRTARTFDALLQRPDLRALDLCCGTGDMTFALRRRAASGGARILGADFSHAMLQRAAAKAAKMAPEHAIKEAPGKGTGAPIRWIEADALRLPFPDGYFHLVTSAFGFRNLADYDAGLREIARVLAPAGECGILDFGEPGGLLGHGYRFYFKNVLPAIGTVLSGVRGPYAYLPASVERFPAPDEMLARMSQAGFRDASWTPYTFGVAGLYRGVKSV
ncbi:MAG: ubiquinone/menaquinone biosynthesis methyltransferase [Terriglobales bacterium]|jgi:demethylmenaquinone methyltransferase/2-methoxy-6-polyprenyl-1,4-benzoquinol methylase